MTTLGLTLWRRFNKLNRTFHDRIPIIITRVIALLSAPALALVSYGVYAFLGVGMTRNGGSHEVTIPVAVTWAIHTNRENKGDRIISSAADTVRQRFVFGDVSDDPLPEKVPLPRPRPAELLALEAPPVDLQPALDRNKREECEWDKLKTVPDFKLETLPDFMRSCLGPPIQLTPPNR